MINFDTKATPEVLEIVSIINELRNTSSSNAKIDILKRNIHNEGLQTILELTYNPHKKYKITEKTLKEGSETGFTYSNLRMLTHTLATSNINDELRMITSNFLAQTDFIIRDLYRGVILKDLRIGLNVSTINKVWKGLIPTSEGGMDIKPMLANKFDFEKPPAGEFAVTEKLDGIRCLIVIEDGVIYLYTRQGKLIEGCVEIENELKQMIQEWGINNLVFDGELLATGCNYETVYKETTKRVKNKNDVKTGIKYKIFDLLSLDEFVNKKCSRTYEERMRTLFNLFISSEKNGYTTQFISPLKPLYIGNNLDTLVSLLDMYKKLGAEGLMVNLMDAPYEFKRSKAILKVKVMQTADLRIIGFEEGQGRNAGKLGALLVDFKGNAVGVGSGFTDYDREHIWNHQEQYLNKIAEIQYFEITKDKTGTESLRFPVWKFLREDKNEPSLF